jgi:hypothetical protein
LLDDLVNAAALNSPTSPEAKQRALLTLKHVVHALRFKRIVIETHAPARGRVSPEGKQGALLKEVFVTEGQWLLVGILNISSATLGNM